MKLILAPEVQDVVDRWSADQYVDPSALRRAIDELMESVRMHAGEMADGDVIHWANIAGLMNRDLRKMETRRRFLREGIPS